MWPVIIIGFLIGKGLGDVVNAGDRIDDAKRYYKTNRRAYEEWEEDYQQFMANSREEIDNLGKAKLQAAQALGPAVDLVKKAKIKERDLMEKVDIKPEKFAELETISVRAGEVLNAPNAIVSGAVTACGVYGLVGTLGTASTGTAIASLSGVAASNATLAWLGGGSLAAGGGGVALGSWVLGGLVAGPALFVMGISAQTRAAEVETHVVREVNKMCEAVGKMKKQIQVVKTILARADEIKQTVTSLAETLSSLVEKTSPESVEGVYQVAKVAKALGEALDSSVKP